MTTLFLIGRLLFGGYFAYSGLNHLMHTKMLGDYAKSKGVPFPVFSVILSGLFILLGGIGVLFWIYVKWSLLLISIFLLIVSFMMHNFWSDTDPNMKMNNQINFSKNMALLGAVLVMLTL